MEQFDLSIWLQDKSRKVVTRRGNPVRIVCWDAKGLFPILALLEGDGKMDTKKGDEYPCSYRIDGTCPVTESYDLFFADEKEELTEFDYAVLSIISDHNSHTDSIEAFAKRSSRKLIDLARKKIRKEQQEKLGTLEMPIDVTEPYYIKCKQDALKDLPKWKKATEHKDLEKHIAILEENKVFLSDFLEEGDYYIELEDLKTLPKEE